jgi:hypothetical protein
MILLVSPSPKGKQVVREIEKACNTPVWLVLNLDQADKAMASNEYSAVVVDQPVLDMEPDAVSFFLQRAGRALPIFVSLTIACPERVAAEVRAALGRNDQVTRRARQLAREDLRSELKDIVTGLTLECDLTLNLPSMGGDVETRLLGLQRLTGEIRELLEDDSQRAASAAKAGSGSQSQRSKAARASRK